MKTRICSLLMLPLLAVGFLASETLVSAQDSYFQSGLTQGFFNNRRDTASALVIDSVGSLYVGGKTETIYGQAETSPESALVAKYDATGAQQWLSFGYSTIGLDHVAGMAIDSENNVFIGGETYRYPDPTRSFLIKFGPNGTRLWERHLPGTGTDVAVDLLGNSYLAGPGIVKFSPTGVQLWQKNDFAELGNWQKTVAVDATGNFFAAGAKGNDEFISKFNSGGALQWSVTANYSVNPLRETNIVESTTDAAGNIYVVGEANGRYVNGFGYQQLDGVVAKHDPNGNLLWRRIIGGTGLETVTAVTVDLLGNVFVAGATDGDVQGTVAGESDAFWAKLSPTGQVLWLDQFGTSEGNGADGIAVNQTGSVYVLGNTYRHANNYYYGDSDMFMARFDEIPETSTNLLMVLGIFLLVRRPSTC